MKKIILSSWIALYFLVPPAVFAYDALPTAKSALILDHETGEVLFSRSPHVKRAPASTIKILTALTAIDLLPLDSIITEIGRAHV